MFTGVNAPSVHVPESFAITGYGNRSPSVGAQAPLSRCSRCTVLLPESFRGGCSVGVVAVDDLSRASL
jgi:hypothetical protein